LIVPLYLSLLVRKLKLMTSAVLMVGAEEPIDDVDRTDFSDPALQEDPVARGPMGPHSEVEPASLLPDLVNGKVPIGVPSFLLCSLANLGGKMFNVSAFSGVLLDASGKEVQKLTKRQYGEPLGPREQRSFRFGFTPKEETPPGQYKLVFSVFYNNRDKDQFNDTVYEEAAELVPAPPSFDAQLKMIQGGIGAVFLVIVLGFFSSRGGGKSSGEAKATSSKAKSPKSGVAADEWLSATSAVNENRAQNGAKKRAPKRS